MEVSLRQLSPLGSPSRGRPPIPPAPEPPEAPEEGPATTGREAWLAGGMLGLTALGLLGTYAGSHLPLCDTAQVQLCVPESLATPSATAWRYLQAPAHLVDTLSSWQNQSHQVVKAPPDSQNSTAADHVQLVSWNLHHGLSQDSSGARPQLDTMIEQLKSENADVILLQEVAPNQVNDLAERLGMQGYYAATTPVQGNMILLNPDIQVKEEHVVFTTGEQPGQAWDTLKGWVGQGGGPGEPRNLQMLEVELPNGDQALIWNTHHLTGAYSEEQQQQAAQVLGSALQSEINQRPERLVIGGGDLNARVDQQHHPVVRHLNRLAGLQTQADRLDWIVTNAPQQFSSEWVRQADCTVVSDHPLVRSQVDL